MKISEELASAYRSAKGGIPGERSWILADALRDAVAEADKKDFQLHHWLYDRRDLQWCLSCSLDKDGDPRHYWEFSDWQAAAHKKLMGEP